MPPGWKTSGRNAQTSPPILNRPKFIAVLDPCAWNRKVRLQVESSSKGALNRQALGFEKGTGMPRSLFVGQPFLVGMQPPAQWIYFSTELLHRAVLWSEHLGLLADALQRFSTLSPPPDLCMWCISSWFCQDVEPCNFRRGSGTHPKRIVTYFVRRGFSSRTSPDERFGRRCCQDQCGSLLLRGQLAPRLCELQQPSIAVECALMRPIARKGAQLHSCSTHGSMILIIALCRSYTLR